MDGLDEDALEWAKNEFEPEEEEEEEEEEEDEDKDDGASKSKKPTGPEQLKGHTGIRRKLDEREDRHWGIPDGYKRWNHKVSKECIRSLVNHEWREYFYAISGSDYTNKRC